MHYQSICESAVRQKFKKQIEVETMEGNKMKIMLRAAITT